MKNKLKILLFSCILMLACGLLFVACEENDTTSTSTQIIQSAVEEKSTGVDTNELVTEEHVHKFGEWGVVKEASCVEDGREERSCSCGEKETQIITKGFADTQVEETNQIINLILDRANTNFKNALAKQKTLNINSLKNTLIQTLKPYIYEVTEKYPVILPIINVIE